ncbi:MAG: hypothetical protein E7320_07675 [Clostridiales bacterium]|nr:hypothetical protein [Clostridiales bacterium]
MKRFRHIRRCLALLVALMMLISAGALAERYRTLEYGDRGEEVLRLQQALLELGYDPEGTDGKFGRGTEYAVKLYQAANSLEPDGKAGHLTLSKLYDGPSIAADGSLATVTGSGSSGSSSSGSSGNGSSGSGSSGSGSSASGSGSSSDLQDLMANAAGSTNPNTIKYGNSGSRVSELQTMLVQLGYDVGGIDGKFGTGTLRALVQFQKDNGLTPDGLCGTQTMALIRQKLEAQAPGSGSAGNTGNGGSSSDSGSSGNTGSGSSGSGSSSTGSGSGASGSDLQDLVANAAGSTNPNTIKYGNSGDRVTELQTMLTRLGYSTGGIDGKFGTGTLRALVQFQKDNSLTPDGLCGTQTMALIRQKIAALEAGSNTGASGSTGSGSTGGSGSTEGGSSSGSTGSGNTDSGSSGSTGNTGSGSTGNALPSGLSRTLYNGCTGQDVLTVQRRLKELGYYKSLLDGVYGNGSVAAVRAFQQNNGLTADGLAGMRTFKVLFSEKAIAADGSTAGGSSSGNNSSGSGNTDSGSNSSGSGSNSSGNTGSGNTGSGSNSGNTGSNDSGSGSTDTGYTTLSYGSKGEAVRKLQQALKALNYNVTADGDYGALTQMAVNAFQQCNGMVPTGTADPTTQALLYSGKAKPYDASIAGSDSELPEGTGVATGPSTGSVKLLHWFREIKPTVRSGQTVKVFDPATNLQWTLRFYSLGRHADSEPLTETDTKIMFKAFGYKNTWTPKPVYVQLPSGTWVLATMHNVPHLSGSIQNNGFNGHLCVHFLRDMDECSKNDPDYGVQNQKAIRKKWLEMTGQVVE